MFRTIRLAAGGDGFAILNEVAEASDASLTARRDRPDVLLIDIDLPGGGIRLVEEVAMATPGVLIVVVGDSPTDDELFDALYAGASGFVPRTLSPDRWRACLESLLRGEALLPRALTSRLVEEFRARGRRKRLSLRGRPGVDLTSREWTILQHVGEDLSTNEIAERLFVSPVTVRSHLSAVMRKLDVPDRRALRRLIRER